MLCNNKIIFPVYVFISLSMILFLYIEEEWSEYALNIPSGKWIKVCENFNY